MGSVWVEMSNGDLIDVAGRSVGIVDTVLVCTATNRTGFAGLYDGPHESVAWARLKERILSGATSIRFEDYDPGAKAETERDGALASALASALARAEKAEAERDALLQRAEKAEAMVAQVVSLEKCSIDETESKLTLASRTLQGLLSAWGDLLIANKARNFLCIDFVHDELGVVHVTVQLDHGETPIQQRDHWRERAEKAEAELDRIAASASLTPDDLETLSRAEKLAPEPFCVCGQDADVRAIAAIVRKILACQKAAPAPEAEP